MQKEKQEMLNMQFWSLRSAQSFQSVFLNYSGHGSSKCVCVSKLHPQYPVLCHLFNFTFIIKLHAVENTFYLNYYFAFEAKIFLAILR